VAGKQGNTLILLLANALVPIFAGLLLGYFAGLRKVVDNINLKSLITFLMSFALPCSLFSAIAKTPHAQLVGQGRITLVLAIVYLAIYFLTYFVARKMGKLSASDSAVLALTLGFPNATAVGLPLLATYGPSALVSCAAGIAIGAITISPITLAILESGTDAGKAMSTSTRIRMAAWKAVKRPVVWAPVLGVVAVIVGLVLPPYADRSLTVMGGATAATALFLTGLVVSAQRFALNWSVAASVFAKNLLQPALCLVVAKALGLSLEQTKYAVLIGAIPCGFFGLVFGKGFNSTPETASSSIIASYVVGIFTLAGWIVVVSHLQ